MKALFSAAQPFRMSLWHAYRFRCVGILAAWTRAARWLSCRAQPSERMMLEVVLVWWGVEAAARVAGARVWRGKRGVSARLHLGPARSEAASSDLKSLRSSSGRPPAAAAGCWGSGQRPAAVEGSSEP